MTARRPVSGQTGVRARANNYTSAVKYRLCGAGATCQTARASAGCTGYIFYICRE